jgi:hypothetical protein
MTGSQQGDSALMLAIVGVSVINPVKRMTGDERLNEDEQRKADESRRRFRSGTSWRQVRPKASHGLTVLPEPLMCKRFVAFFDTLADLAAKKREIHQLPAHGDSALPSKPARWMTFPN